MKRLAITNPFGAAVYYREIVSSTMDEARVLAGQGEAPGTVITADFQESGRGRTSRPWIADRGANLFFTILLRYAGFTALPKAITLRTGLALAQAVEDLAPPLAGSAQVKWPNDLMLISPNAQVPRIQAAKAAGILTEGDGETLYIGVGVNVAQREFPENIKAKATSIALALEGLAVLPADARFCLLERLLFHLYRELEPCREEPERPWRDRLEERLYMKGKPVRFIPGEANSEKLVEGILDGIGPEGELLIRQEGAAAPQAFVTGELQVY